MAEPSVEAHIRRWLARMVRLTAVGSDPVSAEKLADYADMLARDQLPSSAFTADSLHVALQGQTFFPSYDQIRVAVEGWWSANKPASAPRLTGSDSTLILPPQDASWLGYYRRRRAEIEDAPGYRAMLDRDRDPHAFACSDLGRLESLVRRQSPRAWEVIAGKPPAEPDPRQPSTTRQQELDGLPAPLKAVGRSMAQQLASDELDARMARWSSTSMGGQIRAAQADAPETQPLRDVTARGETLEAIRQAAAEQLAQRRREAGL